MFTTTRPQLTPQAMPKLLKFKFDDKTLKKKYKQRASPENPSPTKRNFKRKISSLF
jgi:hypothetical protein